MSDQRDPQTYALIGACMEVHRELGSGFLEAVYQDAVEIELKQRGIPYVREAPIRDYYKRSELASKYRADFHCYQSVVLELKAKSALTGQDSAQVINYLKATGVRRALLVNFGASSLQYDRLVLGWNDSQQEGVCPQIFAD